MPTLDCLHKHIFLLHVNRSVSLARMRRYTQLAYLFHQCATSLLSRVGRIVDCTVRHPGMERPFSSLSQNFHFFGVAVRSLAHNLTKGRLESHTLYWCCTSLTQSFLEDICSSSEAGFSNTRKVLYLIRKNKVTVKSVC